MNEAQRLEYDTKEWKRKRLEILMRDDLTCQQCGSNNKLHVHHKKYGKGLKCWQYDDDLLITLCSVCHNNIHLNNRADFFYSNKKITACSRYFKGTFISDIVGIIKRLKKLKPITPLEEIKVRYLIINHQKILDEFFPDGDPQEKIKQKRNRKKYKLKKLAEKNNLKLKK